MRSLVLPCLLFAAASASFLPRHAGLSKRDGSQVCNDLTVSSNNGDRKVAVVIDSSGSMAYTDPSDLRLVAGRALNDFLIGSSEANGNQKADQVSVIDFDDVATLDYALGDPGSANDSFSKIDAAGGTFIAEGVRMAMDQLTGGNSGATDKRSAIVVFTDGADSSTSDLVDTIKKATGMGIRVSFGFLDTSAAGQDPDILKAVRESRGVYATITVAAGSQNFINYVLLNGLTYNDNPQGYDSQLLAGLSETQFISGSDTATLKYSAEQGEEVTFEIVSITAGSLSAVAQMNGQTIDSSTSSRSSSTISVTAPATGELQLLVTAQDASPDSMFSVSTDSNVPIKNCTVGVSNKNQGLSAGAKAGVGVGVTAAVLGLLGAGSYFLWKHFHPPAGNTTAAPPGANTTLATGDGGHSAPMMEKFVPHSDVTALDPSHGAPPSGPSGGPPGATSGGPPGAPAGGPPTGPTGMSPHALSTGLHAAPVAPPTGPAGSMPPMGHTMPTTFIPPMVPPPMMPRSGDDRHDSPRSPASTLVSPQSPNPHMFMDKQPAPGMGYSPSPHHVITPYTPPHHPGTPYGQAHLTPAGPHSTPGHPTPSYDPYYGSHTGTSFAPSPYQQALPGSAVPSHPTDVGPMAGSPQSQGQYYYSHVPAQQPMDAFSPHHTGASGPTPSGHADLPGHGHADVAPPAGPHPGGEPAPPHQPFVPNVSNPPFATGTRADQREKHHHHGWLALDECCVDAACPLHAQEHDLCVSQEGCECFCYNPGCPLNR